MFDQMNDNKTFTFKNQSPTPDNTMFFRGLIEGAFFKPTEFIQAQKFYNIFQIPNVVLVIHGFYTQSTKNRPHPTEQLKEICKFFFQTDGLYFVENDKNLILFYKIPPVYKSAKEFFYTTQILEKIILTLENNFISVRIGVSRLTHNPLNFHHSYTDAVFSSNNQLYTMHAYQFFDDFTKNVHLLNALSYLENNLSENISINDIAKKINFSTSYFHKIFKREMNQTFLEYTTFKKIHAMREEIHGDSTSLEELANKYGFSSVSYFNLIFKKQLGLTPGKYRKAQLLIF